jgi:hypothetical protein
MSVWINSSYFPPECTATSVFNMSTKLSNVDFRRRTKKIKELCISTTDCDDERCLIKLVWFYKWGRYNTNQVLYVIQGYRILSLIFWFLWRVIPVTSQFLRRKGLGVSFGILGTDFSEETGFIFRWSACDLESVRKLLIECIIMFFS